MASQDLVEIERLSWNKSMFPDTVLNDLILFRQLCHAAPVGILPNSEIPN